LYSSISSYNQYSVNLSAGRSETGGDGQIGQGAFVERALEADLLEDFKKDKRA
jgi:hypothetical protein